MALYIKSQNGLTLIEVLVAGFIMITVIIAFGTALVMGRGFIDNEGDRQRALGFAQQKMEELRSAGFNNMIAGNYTDNPTASLLRAWIIQDRTTAVRQLKRAKVTVSSTDDPPKFHDVVLMTYVTAYKDGGSL